MPAGFCSADPLRSLLQHHPSALAGPSIPGLCNVVPQGEKALFFRARRSIFPPGKLMVSLPLSPSQRHITLNPAQGQGHSICLGFSFSPAPASLLPARGLEGCSTWTDVQCPQGRCAPAPGLPPDSCYCRYQAGGGSLTCSPHVQRAGPEGDRGGISLAMAKRAQPFT